jgi:hypothetical protein
MVLIKLNGGIFLRGLLWKSAGSSRTRLGSMMVPTIGFTAYPGYAWGAPVSMRIPKYQVETVANPAKPFDALYFKVQA